MFVLLQIPASYLPIWDFHLIFMNRFSLLTANSNSLIPVKCSTFNIGDKRLLELKGCLQPNSKKENIYIYI